VLTSWPHRLAVGPFSGGGPDLEDIEKNGKFRTPLPAPLSFGPLPARFEALRVDRDQAQRLAQGQTLPWPGKSPAQGEKVRVMADEDWWRWPQCAGKGRTSFGPLRVFHPTREYQNQA